MAKELARELINAGSHFGHAVSRWNPKMAPYIYSKRGMIHVIDVKETLKGLLIAKKLLTKVVSSGKDVIFVGTKRQARKAVETAAADTGMHYVSERWLGGTLTNFRTIRSRLSRLEELEAMETSGALEKESKKQASRLKRELEKIKTNLEGIRNMSRTPGVMVVVDTRKEYIALREARGMGIPTIGIIDTDSDPDQVDVAIPCNDDSLKSINLLLKEMAESVLVGKNLSVNYEQMAPTPQAKPRSRRRALASADEQSSQPNYEESQEAQEASAEKTS